MIIVDLRIGISRKPFDYAGEVDEMRRMVKQYEDPLTPSPKQTREELISHCELFIKYYAQAAEEADTLAEIHRQEDKAIP